MTPEQFVYWLQGLAEMHEGDGISPRQWRIIRDHLSLVFEKQTPIVPPAQPLPTLPGPTPPLFPSDDRTYPHWELPPRVIC